MKNSKKKICMALAGIMLAGSMGWSQLPAQAATNGETVCSHRTSVTKRTGNLLDEYRSIYAGHMQKEEVAEWCTDICKLLIRTSFEYGDLKAHDYSDWEMVEDRGDGLYRHRRQCETCGYEIEELSGSPNYP